MVRNICVLVGVFTIFSLRVFGQNEPVVYDATSLLTPQSGTLELIGGRTIELGTPLPPEGKLLFEDLLPGANWGHPATFKLLNKKGTVLVERTTTIPPAVDLSELPVESGVRPSTWTTINFDLNPLKGKYKVGNPERFHALLINGRADRRHWNDFSFLFRVLTQIYGYNKDNIIVADGTFLERSPDLDGDGLADISYHSRFKDLEKTMDLMKQRLTENDQLLLVVNDHGSVLKGESTIILYDREIRVSEFAKYLEAIPAKKVLSIYEQCFSGSFVRPSTGPLRVAMAASTEREYSWATHNSQFNEFLYHVITAFARQTHQGVRVQSDFDQDGRISAQEAYAYAVAHDERRESPLLEAGINTGMSNQMGFGF